MKFRPLLLGVSLAANAALLVAVARNTFFANPAAPSIAAAPSDAPADAKENTFGDPHNTDQSAATTVSWQRLNGANLPDMVAQLRAAGFPVPLVHAFVRERLREQGEAKMKAVLATVEDVPYWKGGLYSPSSSFPKMMAAKRNVRMEQQQILKELLGPDAINDSDVAVYFRRAQYGNISAQKAADIERVKSDYDEMRREIINTANGSLVQEDRDQIAILDAERRKDMAEILTPEELENYEMRTSSTANMLAMQLSTFEPTEAEFRALFGAARTLGDDYGPTLSGPAAAQRRDAMNEQAKLLLSPERYADFVQATDPKNAMLNRVVGRFALPKTVIPQVNAVQEDILQRARAVMRLPASDRAAQGQVLAREAEAKLLPLLGKRAFAAYKEYGGTWLQRLASPLPPAYTPTPRAPSNPAKTNP